MPLEIRKGTKDSCKPLHANNKKTRFPIDAHQFQKSLLFAKNRAATKSRENHRTSHVATKTDDALKHDGLHEEENLRALYTDTEQLSLITPAYLPVERFTDQHGAIVALIKAHSQVDDDINRLIKKLALSFTAKKNESQFQIAHGVFQGCQFHLLANERDLSLKVGHASLMAKRLLMDNRQKLAKRLATREINLKALRFTS